MSTIIRDANASDLSEMLDIYAPYILNTTYSFEYIVPSEEEFGRRIIDTQAQFPWLVYEHDGHVLGYAYSHKPFSRAAYSWTVETSVYVKKDCHRLGVGKALYDVLLDYLYEMGYVVVYAVIESGNEASIAFHKSLGFREMAVFTDTGYKFGRWLSLYWLEKRLRDNTQNMPKIVSYSDLSAKLKADVINKHIKTNLLT